MKEIRIGWRHLRALWLLTLINLFSAGFHVYLYSEKGIPADFPTIFTANIAVLSAIIVICAFVVTSTGLAKLESIEKEAIEKAKTTATETAQTVLKSEKFLQQVAEATKNEYDRRGGISPSPPSKEDAERETGRDED